MPRRNKSGIHYTQRAKRLFWVLRLVWAIAALSMFSSKALAQVQGRRPVDTCRAVNVIGNWQANVSVDVPRVDVDVSFTFRPDGTYSYAAGQGSFPWTSHDGFYSLAPNRGDQYYRCLLTLTPDPATIRRNPQSRYGLMPLQARSLLADRPKTFRASDSIAAGRLMLFDASLARSGVGMFSLEQVR